MRFCVLERNMTEYYYGDSKDTDRPEICRYKGYGTDSENDYRKWQVLVGRLTFVIVFEVCSLVQLGGGGNSLNH